MDAFPVCGCDACAETLEVEIERLAQLVSDVTNGRFREAIWIPLVGDARQKSELWSPNRHTSIESRIDRSQARQILGESRHLAFEWRQWPRRE